MNSEQLDDRKSTGINRVSDILGTFYSSPLPYAMSIGDIPVMEYLISKGANVNEVDDDGISILAWAAISNRAAAIDLLARRGAKVNSVDRFGMTGLPHAASIDFGDTSVVEKLVALGADAKAKNKEGLTALI